MFSAILISRMKELGKICNSFKGKSSCGRFAEQAKLVLERTAEENRDGAKLQKKGPSPTDNPEALESIPLLSLRTT